MWPRLNHESPASPDGLRRKSANGQSAPIRRGRASSDTDSREDLDAARAAHRHRFQGRFPLTDTGNAERLIARFDGEVRYVSEWRRWLVWDGNRWAVDQGTKVLGLSKEVVRGMSEEASEPGFGDADDQLKWSKTSEAAARRDAMVRLAAAEPGIAVSFKTLNTNPWLLNCRNGTLDLRTGSLRPAAPSDLITQMAVVDFDPTAQCPAWLTFIEEVLAQEEVRRFVQVAVGFSLTGSVEDHALFFCFGDGANGKSTFLEVIQSILGDDYAMSALPDLLIAKGHSHPTEIADLYEKRFIVTNELNSGSRFDEARLKLLTGGDRLRGRRMREDSWQFEPRHHLWLAANNKPDIRGTDEGIWRRIFMIPFSETIPEDRRDRKLKEKLIAEAPGILNWCLIGLVEHQAHGLRAPVEVQAATRAYRADMDDVASFISEQCLKSEIERTERTELYRAYCSWSGDSGKQALRDRNFYSRLEAMGLNRLKSNGKHYFCGICLVPSEEAWR